ncbi:hypothetical protein DVH24_042497 [Malus domestica]|uniref:Uncharacterized protein n=1 Tax=Malus domestica TaxID=3750 RepID=A0A498JFW0_MALDO|nr:hypothetical protein DVH24_042497 [Malus domestica]
MERAPKQKDRQYASYFYMSSLSSEASLHFQLLAMSKGSQSLDVYLQHVKSIANKLASINQPVVDKDIVLVVLRGLGFKYRMSNTAIINGSLTTFVDLRHTFKQQNSRSSSPFNSGVALLMHSAGPTVSSSRSNSL